MFKARVAECVSGCVCVCVCLCSVGCSRLAWQSVCTIKNSMPVWFPTIRCSVGPPMCVCVCVCITKGQCWAALLGVVGARWDGVWSTSHMCVHTHTHTHTPTHTHTHTHT